MATEIPSSRDARRRRRRPVHVARTRSAQPPGTSRPMTAASTVPGASTGAPPSGVGRTGPPGFARAAGPRRRATRRAPAAARRTTSAIGTVGCAAGTARQSRAGTPCTAPHLLGADRPPRTPSRVAVWTLPPWSRGVSGTAGEGGTRVAGDSSVETSRGGRIDLVAMAPDSSLVVIELGRNQDAHEVCPRPFDCASWVEQFDPSDMSTRGLASVHLVAGPHRPRRPAGKTRAACDTIRNDKRSE